MCIVDELVEQFEIEEFLLRSNLMMPDVPDVPALKQEYATCFKHAIRHAISKDICAIVSGVQYENYLEFDVVVSDNGPFEDIYIALCRKYFYRYYRMNISSDHLTWRINGVVQNNPVSSDILTIGTNDRLKRLLNI